MSYVMIISPAKKMNVVEGPPHVTGMPRFINRTEHLMHAVQALNYENAQALWACSDKLAALNYDRFRNMDLTHNLTAAALAYEGIQYQHLAPQIMSDSELAFLDAHLRILSGFYGVLRPFDGVVPYRLEMQAKLAVDGAHNLYEYWSSSLAKTLAEETDTIVNLASVEYAKAITPYAQELGLRVITCLFGQMINGKYVQRPTEAKAARGTFARWCCENKIESENAFPHFTERGYALDESRSTTDSWAYVRI